MTETLTNITIKSTKNGRTFATYTLTSTQHGARNCASFLPSRLRSVADVNAWLMVTLGITMQVRLDALETLAVIAYMRGGMEIKGRKATRVVEALRCAGITTMQHGIGRVWHVETAGMELRVTSYGGGLRVLAYSIEGQELTRERALHGEMARPPRKHRRTPERKNTPAKSDWHVAQGWYRCELAKAGLSRDETSAAHRVILEENKVTTSKDMTAQELRRAARTLQAIPIRERGEYLRGLL